MTCVGAAEWLQNLVLTTFYKRLRCDDGDAATTNDICDSGICQGCPAPEDDCAAAGTFDAVIQQCTAPAVAADGTSYDSETMDKVGATLLTNIYESIATSKFHAASKHKKSRAPRFTLQTTRT